MSRELEASLQLVSQTRRLEESGGACGGRLRSV